MIATLTLLIVSGLVATDSFGSNGTSLKYLKVDSTFLAVGYLLVNCILATFNRYPLPRMVILINKLIFPFLTLAAFVLVLINHANFSTYVLYQFGIQLPNFVFLAILNGAVIYIDYSSKLKDNFEHKILFFLGPLMLLTFLLEDVFGNNLFFFLSQEDGVFETLQFWFFLISSGLALRTALSLRVKKAQTLATLFLILSLGLFFIAGEEISWGQRLLGISTPEIIKQTNYQDEITLHNEGIVQRYIHFFYMAIGLYGSFGRLLLNKSGSLKLITPKLILFFYFFSIFAFYFLNQYLIFYNELWTTSRTGMGRWQELSELFLAFGLLIFTLNSQRETRLVKGQ